MNEELYDVKYVIYQGDDVLMEYYFRREVPKSHAYKVGSGIAESLYLKKCQSNHDLEKAGAEYGWITIMPTDMDEVVVVEPSKVKPEKV